MTPDPQRRPRGSCARISKVQEHDFEQWDADAPGDGWGTSAPTLNLDLLKRLAVAPITDDDDLESASSLTRLTHQQYELFGTGKKQQWTDHQSSIALRTLRQVLLRHGIELNPPWRDFPTFEIYWKQHGCSNNYRARRDLLATHFGAPQDALADAEDNRFRHGLAEGVSPRPKTGWPRVDEEVEALRQRFRTASAMADYRDVGNRSVAVIEALSEIVYDPDKHCPSGESVPPVAKTDIRIGAYIDERLPGPGNEELRGLAKKASALAHRIKHSPSADRTRAGIAADAAILLANILRRLSEPRS